MTANNLSTEIDSMGAPAGAGAGVDSSVSSVSVSESSVAAPPAQPVNDPVPPPAGSEQDQPAITDEFLASFDDLDSETVSGSAQLNQSSQIQSEKASESLPPNASAAQTSGTGEPSQTKPEETSETEKGEQTEKTSTEDDPNRDAAAETATEDWNKVTPEEEEYITKNLPENEWKRARGAFAKSRMATTFLNPSVPANQWVDNLAAKSGTRFTEVETEILKRNASGNPVEFLGRIFEATQDAEGNSPAYQNLLESLVSTNQEFVVSVLEAKGYKLGAAGEEGSGAEKTAAGANESGAADFTDEDIASIRDSVAFKELAEAFPEEAEKWKSFLDAQQQKNARLSEFENKEKELVETSKTEEQKKASDQAIETQRASIETFNNIYAESVTSFVSNQLDTTYGLKVSPEEREKNPTLAFLKDAKKALILSGGLSGGDFDNDLYRYGNERPAFKEAAKAAVRFAQAGERENAVQAAQELVPFAEMFLSERLKTSDVQMLDEIIQAVARDQQTRNTVKHDMPSSDFNVSKQSGKSNFLDEIDHL